MPWLPAQPDVWSGDLAHERFWRAVLKRCGHVRAASVAARLYSRSAALLALPLCLLMRNWSRSLVGAARGHAHRARGIGALLLLLRGRAAIAGWPARSLSDLAEGRVLRGGFLGRVASTIALPGLTYAPAACCLGFGIRYLLTLGLYFGGFLAVASLGTTLETYVVAHQNIAFSEMYETIRKYWRQTLRA